MPTGNGNVSHLCLLLDEGDGNGYAASQPDVGLEPLGHAGVTDVLVRRALPAPRLDAVLQPGRHRRGPRRATYQAEGGKRCLGSCEVLRQILEELRRGHETDQEAVKNKMFPERSSGSLPVPAEETVATQAISTPVLPRPREDRQSSVYEFFRTDSGAVGERIPSVSSPQSTTRGRWPQNAQRHCMVAAVVSLPLAILLCFVVICLRTKRK
ncbi:uncharacterized protein LOC118453219, partial [Egretta garzetta]|uniref:uncharacterized protein LOC118453219 n=1 Tax=Egretta garzetta TaxID=188379 RepID=UPI00163D27BC